jgi:diguanylate cyclase (GGDEF)-like protein/PAS domain S-box-containing protein
MFHRLYLALGLLFTGITVIIFRLGRGWMAAVCGLLFLGALVWIIRQLQACSRELGRQGGELNALSARCGKVQKDLGQRDLEVKKKDILLQRRTNTTKYYERILQDSTDIIFTLDVDGYILKFNRGAEARLAYSQEEIVGKQFSTLLQDENTARQLFDEVLRESEVSGREVTLRGRDGGTIFADLSISEMKTDKAIMGFVVIGKDITEKKRLEAELIKKNLLLEELAITDNLSGLFNVRHFRDELKKTYHQLERRFLHVVSLALIDIDHFKELNDAEGHQRGDEAIRAIGEIVNSSIRRDIDNGFRYGGDEFILLLPETNKTGAVTVAQRIIDRYARKKFGRTTMSIGITEIDPKEDEKTIIQRADDTMYTAKRAGGNRLQVF